MCQMHEDTQDVDAQQIHPGVGTHKGTAESSDDEPAKKDKKKKGTKEEER